MYTQLRYLFYLFPLLSLANAPALPIKNTPIKNQLPQIQVKTPVKIKSQIETYFNTLPDFKVRFTQTVLNGPKKNSQSYGHLVMYRPPLHSKYTPALHMSYHDPDKILIVARGSRLLYHEARSNQVSWTDVNKTPAQFLMKRPFKLDGDVSITHFLQSDNQIEVGLKPIDSQKINGHVVLLFTKNKTLDNPLTLKGWTITDPQQTRIQITLDHWRTEPLTSQQRSVLFSTADPRQRADGQSPFTILKPWYEPQK
jgi:outer membrane lipoprotein-sorting protein